MKTKLFELSEDDILILDNKPFRFNRTFYKRTWYGKILAKMFISDYDEDKKSFVKNMDIAINQDGNYELQT